VTTRKYRTCSNGIKHFWKGAKIHLQAQEWDLKRFVIGISKSKASESTWPELFDELNKNYGPGRRQQWWYYYRQTDNFADWHAEETLESCSYVQYPFQA
jgi:hypothetical protein